MWPLLACTVLVPEVLLDYTSYAWPLAKICYPSFSLQKPKSKRQSSWNRTQSPDGWCGENNDNLTQHSHLGPAKVNPVQSSQLLSNMEQIVKQIKNHHTNNYKSTNHIEIPHHTGRKPCEPLSPSQKDHLLPLPNEGKDSANEVEWNNFFGEMIKQHTPTHQAKVLKRK